MITKLFDYVTFRCMLFLSVYALSMRVDPTNATGKVDPTKMPGANIYSFALQYFYFFHTVYANYH